MAKLQTTLKWTIIVAIVAIIAISGSLLYFKATSGKTIGNSVSMMAVGFNTATDTLIVATSVPIPASKDLSAINFSTSGGTLTAVGDVIPAPVYVDGYPEYAFAVTNAAMFKAVVITPNSTTISSMTYTTSANSPIGIPTSTGKPMVIVRVNGNATISP